MGLNSKRMNHLYVLTLFALFCSLGYALLQVNIECYGFANVTNVTGSQAKNVTLPGPIKIAFLVPTFTHAAYQNNSFYNFYRKYYTILSHDTKLNPDLEWLINKKIPHGPINSYNDPPGAYKYVPYSEFLAKLVESANEVLPTANVTMLNDEDIEAGKLFNSNGNNAFDILIYFMKNMRHKTLTIVLRNLLQTEELLSLLNLTYLLWRSNIIKEMI